MVPMIKNMAEYTIKWFGDGLISFCVMIPITSIVIKPEASILVVFFLPYAMHYVVEV
jgi:hypothetical protein